MLTRNTYFVKERVSALKLTDTYDVFDAETQQTIGVAREEPASWAKWLRLLVKKQMLPTVINIYASDNGNPKFSIRKPFTFIRAKVTVADDSGAELGYFKAKIFSLGGGFFVYDMKDNQIAEVKGDWKGWNFKFIGPGGRELGTVTKKWAGIGKEMFTSADNYVIALSEGIAASDAVKMLLISAGLAIDIVFKEHQ